MAQELYLIGVDEVGRGPLAGPVTAASVVFAFEYSNEEITDSKKLSEKKRERLFDEITKNALAFSVVSVGPRRIEQLNIREASRLAMKLSAERVVAQLGHRGIGSSELKFLVDGNVGMGTTYSEETIIKGDSKVPVIGAASILAKVTRDRMMADLEQIYPGYGLSGHKGYPTKSHKESIEKLGPTRIHRKTFSGVRQHC